MPEPPGGDDDHRHRNRDVGHQNQDGSARDHDRVSTRRSPPARRPIRPATATASTTATVPRLQHGSGPALYSGKMVDVFVLHGNGPARLRNGFLADHDRPRRNVHFRPDLRVRRPDQLRDRSGDLRSAVADANQGLALRRNALRDRPGAVGTTQSSPRANQLNCRCTLSSPTSCGDKRDVPRPGDGLRRTRWAAAAVGARGHVDHAARRRHRPRPKPTIWEMHRPVERTVATFSRSPGAHASNRRGVRVHPYPRRGDHRGLGPRPRSRTLGEAQGPCCTR